MDFCWDLKRQPLPCPLSWGVVEDGEQVLCGHGLRLHLSLLGLFLFVTLVLRAPILKPHFHLHNTNTTWWENEPGRWQLSIQSRELVEHFWTNPSMAFISNDRSFVLPQHDWFHFSIRRSQVLSILSNCSNFLSCEYDKEYTNTKMNGPICWYVSLVWIQTTDQNWVLNQFS